MPRLLPLPALALTLGPLFLACDAGPRSARGIVLISIDTLRADRLGCYGYEAPTSPHLDALAAEGAIFEQAWATSPWTLPSHASLFTGLYPSRHGVTSLETRLPRDVPTLASLLSLQGFTTKAIVNHLFLSARFGMEQGFADFANVEVEAAGSAARRVTDLAIEWLRSSGGERFLLFLHYFDVHSDYAPSPEFARMFVRGESEYDGSTDQLAALVRGERVASPSDAEHLSQLYDAEIRQLDEQLGRLFDWLREAELLDEVLVVVTSDHGEEFMDHGSFLHSQTQYQEMLNVPLIMRGPGIPPARIDVPVSIVDVVPTVLAALGMKAPSGLDGRDLLPLALGREPAADGRRLFSQGAPAGGGGDTLRAVRGDRYKLIADLEGGSRALYDLKEDPGERRDLAGDLPDVARELEESLDRLRAEKRAAPPPPPPVLTPKLRDELRALGYL